MNLKTLLAAPALAALITAGCGAAMAESPPHKLPEPAVSAPAPAGLETAVFSGGCFWGVQAVFSHVKGVTQAISGYAGGPASAAQYEIVSSGQTGHAESVRVTFDPKVVSYGELLRIFFSVTLDPTEVDRQGPDEGSQYRSVIWASDRDQAKVAAAYIDQLNRSHAFPRAIATKVSDLKGFYPAEGYHQDFFALHPDHPYIRMWDVEKVSALKSLFPDRYSAQRAKGTV